MIALQESLRDDLTDLKGVRRSLQRAIALEHATIPPYLYALYSLVPGRNDTIAGLVRSVVLEEMSHMTLAANILNAIGGAPEIDHPRFVPSYPGPLPGGVEQGLRVPLAHFSIDLVRSVFMVIEEPEDPIEFELAAAAVPEPLTIGAFYRTISGLLGDDMFTGDPARQVSLDFGAVKVDKIDDVASARSAIDDIVEEGEGTATSPLDGEHELAHYYRFSEIAEGRALIPDASKPKGFSYSGPAITFDPAGVFALPGNPKLAAYPPNSEARRRCATFNYTYTSLLKTLHATFNGQPDRMHAAIGLMESLKVQALDMATATPPIGPSFEYQLENPA